MTAASSTAPILRRVFVSGRVQGVGFRENTVREANSYPDLRGFVRNLADGRVEALFFGEESAVLKMVAWCGRGPATAHVTRLEVIEENADHPPTDFASGFVRK